MNETLETILDDSNLSESELMDFIYSYMKFVKTGMLTEESFIEILRTLNIEWDGKNKFILSENVEYTLNWLVFKNSQVAEVGTF